MVALRNPQDERASQHLAAGFALTPEERAKRGLEPDSTLLEDAAAIGGLNTRASSFKANARKYCRRKAIRDRVAEIQYAGAALASTSVGSLIVEAEAARAGAMLKKDFSAAIAGVQTKAKLAGIWRDRLEATGKDGAPLPVAAVGPTIIMTGAPPAAQNASA
jgi:hypothetical protein